MALSVIIVDALARGYYGRRIVTVDAIGAGPRTVGGVLEQLGVDVSLATAEAVLENPNILNAFDVLMISAMSIDKPTINMLSRVWRRKRRGPIILGGPASFDPNLVSSVDVDLAVYGEAEPVVESLFKREAVTSKGVSYDELEDLCGIMYKVKGRLIIKRRCPILRRREWEKYKPSTRLIRHYPLYWASRVYVEVVRGCSNYAIPDLRPLIPENLMPDKPMPGCAYCSVVSLWGYARSRSIELVYQEVKALVDEGVRRIVLSGPDFLDYGRDWLVEPKPLLNPRQPGPNIEAIRKLLERLTSIPEIASGDVSLMVENVKPSLVNEDTARVLGEYLPGTPVHLGLEVADDKLLKLLGRPASTYDTYRAVALLVKHGLKPYVYVMYCLPGETRQTIAKTIRFMKKLYVLGAEKFTAYKFTPLPQSALHKINTKLLKCPSPHPVKSEAEKLNRKAKTRLVGSTIKALVVGTHPRIGRHIAYPLAHGPVIILDDRKDATLKIGDAVLVRITSVYSDRMIVGRVIERYPARRVDGKREY